MARNDDRARARRNKRRGEDDSPAEEAAETTGAAPLEGGSDDSSSGLTDTQRAENESRMGLSGAVEAPSDLGMTEEEYDDASDFVPDSGGAVVGGEVTTKSGGPRVIRFFRASWAELQRVIWPTRQQVAQGTAVTLGFVVIAGVYLGVADVAARAIVNLII
ncbi:MAG: preprotein translocase subunit SecE [Solirubrobacteraceae bacterium]|nr:preprotein translocase subunit SecE [Patulibacter sp.]